MKLGKLYEQIVKTGIENDPRGKKSVSSDLARKKERYKQLRDKDKEFFDKDSLFNPYADTRLLFGDKDKEIKTIFVGIDVGGEELLLIDRLNQKRKKKIDLAISHHPWGRALASIFEVMSMQAELLAQVGVSISLAESLTSERAKEVERRFMPVNNMRAVDTARLLNIPFLCMHTAADNCVATYLQKIIDKKAPQKLQDIIDILHQMPEYKYAAVNKNGPKIICGSPNSKAGKTFVDMTGGTEGSRDVFAKLADKGISTLICMHLSEEHFKNVKKERINVVIAGHISSDSVGINLQLDRLEKKARLEIICGGGFKRYKR
ncbi:MAG: NGG1p interacting factor NIF3 [Candidatus Omnitrophica bacterium]|nr:NGG1p interacting factor NIF3 [Candidatus Omnitrophota bacterium]